MIIDANTQNKEKRMNVLQSNYGFDSTLRSFFEACSRSQLQQDVFALLELNLKKGGYFVEFGATNGVDLSNTHLLEIEFGWTGILAEPATSWFPALIQNRKCHIDHRAVWNQSGKTLLFNEPLGAQLATIDSYSEYDFHSASRIEGKKYQVQSITLEDLLDSYGAPKDIDFLSIDTEGSELDILQSFPFDRYKFKIIVCEHNFSKNRSQINCLLLGHGYIQKHQEISDFDDWYVLTNV